MGSITSTNPTNAALHGHIEPPQLARTREVNSFMPPSNYGDLIQNRHGNNPLEFAQQSAQIVNQTVNWLRAKTIDRFLLKDVLDFLAKKRSELAYQLQTFHPEWFGTWINASDKPGRIFTPLHGSYKYYGNLCREIILKDMQNPSTWENEGRCRESENFQTKIICLDKCQIEQIIKQKSLVLNEANNRIEFFVIGSILNKLTDQLPSPLIGCCLRCNLLKVQGKWLPLSSLILIKQEIHYQPVGIIHGSSEEVEPIIEYTAPLFEKLLLWREADGQTVLWESIGELHFLLSQLTPFCAGTAAILEYLTKAVLKFHNQDIHPYKDPLRPDLETHLHTLEEFKKIYQGLFDTSPSQYN